MFQSTRFGLHQGVGGSVAEGRDDSRKRWALVRSSHPWVEKERQLHICVAYLALNKTTERESWPFPNIKEVLDNLAGHRYYTTLDGFSGFNTIPIRAQDQHYTTLRIPFGTYCYTVMPFGLKNAPHMYCRYVMTKLQSLLKNCVQTYMDDVAVYSNDFDAHLRHLEATLQLAVDGEMKIHRGKAHFWCTNVEVIGIE